MLSKNTLYSYDMVKISSGEILTLCGNYDGPIVRVRLSFYPQTNGERIIEGHPYTKVTYETGYTIPHCQKVWTYQGSNIFFSIILNYQDIQGFSNI